MVSTLTWHNANIHELGECGRRFANGTADIPQTQTHMHARVRRLHSAQISAGLETYPKVHHISYVCAQKWQIEEKAQSQNTNMKSECAERRKTMKKTEIEI